MSYEETMERVEKALDRLSEKNIPLGEAVEIYRSALTDLDNCRKELDAAKLVITDGDDND